MDAPTRALAELAADLVGGGLALGDFAHRYQRQYSDHPPDTRAFHILDPLWMVCEEYDDDPALHEPGDTTDDELVAAARQALRELALCFTGVADLERRARLDERDPAGTQRAEGLFESLTSLTRRFVDGEIDAETFVLSYQGTYKDLPALKHAYFVVVDRLFFVCEEYYPDPDFREPGDTTDKELLAGARRALRELEELGG